LRSVWEILHPYPEVEEGKVTEDSFVVSIGGIWEHLEHGISGNIDQRYLDPAGFYRRTHFTDAMKELMSQIIIRLKGGSAQAIHHLQVGMGGGKSHTLLLLYYMAKYKGKALPYLKRQAIADDVPNFRVAILDGSRISPTFGKSFPDGSKVLSLWGLLFKQLGVYEKFKEVDKLEEGPDISMIREALESKPTLILIDEITMYITNSPSRLASRIQAFLQALTAAIKETPGSAMVIATPIGVFKEALDQVSDIVTRYCTPTIIAAAREYKNIRKRALFTDDFDSITPEIEEIAREFETVYRQQVPERAATLVTSINDNYPFHPFVDRTLQRLKEHSAFQEVRDELRFLAGLTYGVWQHKEPNVYLITTGHADLENQYVRGGTITKLRDPIIVARLDTDLEERFDNIPSEIRNVAKKVLATIVLNSLSGSPLDRGITRQEAIYALLTPETTPVLIDEALKHILTQLFFVNSQRDRYVFGQPNINKLIDDYVKKVETDQKLKGGWWDIIRSELVSWKNNALRQYNRKARDKQVDILFNSEDVIIWANRSDEVPDDKAIKLIFTDYIIPETSQSSDEEKVTTIQRVAQSNVEACEAVKDMYESYGQTPRNYKNTVYFLVADKTLVEKNGPVSTAKQIMALEEMLKDREDLKNLIGESGIGTIEHSKADMERDLRPSCVAAYQYLVYPSSGGLASIQLGEERRAIDQFLNLIEERLDTQIKKILRNMTSDALLDRYWPKTRERVEVGDLINGFYRRPEIEIIAHRQVVESAIREALTQGDLAYTYQNEIYYNKEPLLIDEKGILVKNPDVVTISIEAIDDKRDSLKIRLLIDGRREVFTPAILQDLKDISHTIRPTHPNELIFKGWRDGFPTDERTITWNQSRTLLLEYEREEIPTQDVKLEIRAIDTKTNTQLGVAILINGISYQTPVEEKYPQGKRCEIKMATPSGMSFQGWSDGSRYLERTITCDYDNLFTATFEQVTPGVEILKWSGPTHEGIKRLQGLLEGSARFINNEFSIDFNDLSKNLGALLQLMKQPYIIDVQASGGQALGFEDLSFTAKTSSEKQSGMRTCLTQLKSYLEEATFILEKTETDYKPMKELITAEALKALEKMSGNLSYEIHMLTDPTRKPEPTRSLKSLIDEFKRVG